MRVRWIGLVCALAAVAALVGYLAGTRTLAEPTTYAGARPVTAVSPSTPVDSPSPYSPDIDYPALEPGLSYREHRIGTPGYRWAYDVPKGWVIDPTGFQEVRWRPAGEPEVGGYSLRVKIINEHLTNAQMVEQKLVAVRSSYQDVHIITHTQDTLGFGYREPTTNQKRFNTFRWFTPTGGVTAEFELSVVGRAADVDGLDDLLDHVSDSVRKLP